MLEIQDILWGFLKRNPKMKYHTIQKQWQNTEFIFEYSGIQVFRLNCLILVISVDAVVGT